MTLNIEILVLGLIISAVIISVGYIIQRRGEFLRLAGYIIIIIMGLVMLTNTLVFNSGDNIRGNFSYTTFEGDTVLNESSYSITKTYDSQNSTLTTIFGFVIMILGFFGVVDTAREMNVRKKRDLEADEGHVQDEIQGKDNHHDEDF